MRLDAQIVAQPNEQPGNAAVAGARIAAAQPADAQAAPQTAADAQNAPVAPAVLRSCAAFFSRFVPFYPYSHLQNTRSRIHTTSGI